jgi:phosphodiesterase/alkaline phosphatase D-like protein
MRKIVLMSLVVAIAVASVAWAATTPAVGTGAATAVSNSGAVLHGTVNPGGASTAYNFEFGPTIAYGAFSGTNHASGTKAVPVTERLAGLTPGTLYHYRIESSNKLGSAFGGDRVFTTTGHPPPSAVTGVATGITNTTATLTGTVVTNGQTTSAYFLWGTAPTYGNQTAATNVSAALTPMPVSYTLTGLAPGTTFHYQLVASHPGVAPQAGLDQAFTTIPLVRWRSAVTAHTTPSRVRHKPFQFTTTGTVVPSVALPPGVGCTGLVYVRYLRGRKAVAFRKVPLVSNCTYGTSVAFRRRIAHTTTRLRVVVRFQGNAYLRPANARTRRVKLG